VLITLEGKGCIAFIAEAQHIKATASEKVSLLKVDRQPQPHL